MWDDIETEYRKLSRRLDRSKPRTGKITVDSPILKGFADHRYTFITGEEHNKKQEELRKQLLLTQQQQTQLHFPQNPMSTLQPNNLVQQQQIQQQMQRQQLQQPQPPFNMGPLNTLGSQGQPQPSFQFNPQPPFHTGPMNIQGIQQLQQRQQQLIQQQLQQSQQQPMLMQQYLFNQNNQPKQWLYNKDNAKKATLDEKQFYLDVRKKLTELQDQLAEFQVMIEALQSHHEKIAPKF